MDDLKGIFDDDNYEENDTIFKNKIQKPFLQYKPVYEYASMELNCLINGKDPKEILSDNKYSLKKLIKNMKKIGHLIIEKNDGCSVTHVVYGKDMVAL